MRGLLRLEYPDHNRQLATMYEKHLTTRLQSGGVASLQEERLRKALELMQIGVWEWIPATGTYTWNSCMVQLLQLPLNSPDVYTAWCDRIHPEDLEMIQQHIHQLIHGQCFSLTYDYRYRTPQDSYAWHSLSACRAESGPGNLKLLGLLQDITNRKQTEAALKRSQEQYANLVNTIDGIVWELDLACQQFTLVSQQAERLLGYPVEDWYNQEAFWENHLHPEDRDWVIQSCLEQTALKQDHDFEYRMIAANNRVVWLRDIVKVVLQEDQPVALRGVMIDITEAKQAEQNLRQFERIVSATPDAVALLSCDYIYQVVNQTYLHWNQLTDDKIIGHSMADLLGPEVFTSVVKPRIDRALGGEIVHYQEWFDLPALGPQFINVTYAPYYDHHEIIVGVVATSRNITDLKRAEVALLQEGERQALLANITNHIRQSLDLDTILATTVEDVRQYLRADRTLVYRFDAELSSGTVIAESVEAPWQSLLGRQIKDPCLTPEGCLELYQQGRIQRVENVATANLAPCYTQMLRDVQAQANLVLPILHGQAVWGFLVAQQCRTPRRWQPQEIDLLQQFTDQLAIAIQQSELYAQLQQANKQLHHLANHDQLTTIANRRYFDQHLDQEWQRLARRQQPLTLILCDVDYFKRYNDTYGHPAGDTCLQQVAQILRTSAQRPADLVARYGGEEFGIILPETDAAGGIRIVHSIQNRLRWQKLPHATSLVAEHITLSFGVACGHPRPSTSPQELIRQADEALYQAKKAGRNQYCSP